MTTAAALIRRHGDVFGDVGIGREGRDDGVQAVVVAPSAEEAGGEADVVGHVGPIRRRNGEGGGGKNREGGCDAAQAGSV